MKVLLVKQLYHGTKGINNYEKNKKILILALTITMLPFTNYSISAEEKIKKNETVYYSLDANGKIQSEQVNVQLESENKIGKIEDITNLYDIESIENDLNYTKSEKGIIWDLDMNQHHYKGQTNEASPIDIDIKYFLNGQEKDVSQLPGESGDLQIKINLKNNDYNEKQELNTYLLLGFVSFKEDKFSNIKLNVAKIKSDGDKFLLSFASVPGLKEKELKNSQN